MIKPVEVVSTETKLTKTKPFGRTIVTSADVFVASFVAIA